MEVKSRSQARKVSRVESLFCSIDLPEVSSPKFELELHSLVTLEFSLVKGATMQSGIGVDLHISPSHDVYWDEGRSEHLNTIEVDCWVQRRPHSHSAIPGVGHILVIVMASTVL